MKTTLPPEWNRLSQKRREFALWYLRLLTAIIYLASIPKVIWLIVVHGLTTMLTLFLMPPPPQLPAIAIPIVYCASIGTTMFIYSSFKIFRM
jgi:hypothetical protein